MHDEHAGGGRDLHDGREILHRIERHVFVKTGIHRPGADCRDHNRIAVRRRFGGEFESDVAVGAAAIVDDELLAEPLAEFFAQHAALDVGRAAGDERHDETHGLARVLLRRGAGRQRG